MMVEHLHKKWEWVVEREQDLYDSVLIVVDVETVEMKNLRLSRCNGRFVVGSLNERSNYKR